jgi:hypothetical protein
LASVNNIHVTGSGTALSQSATITSTITNVGTGTADTLDYTGLTATSSGTPSPGIVGSATAGGPLANGGGSGSNTALTFSSATAGAFTINPAIGTATNDTAGGSATLGTKTPVTVNVWNLATATINSTTNPSVNLVSIHTGGTFGASALTIANTATAGVSEGLDASFGTATGSAMSNGGTITTPLAAGSSNNTSLTVTIAGGAQNTAGTFTGTVPVNLTSDGTGTSGLGTTALTTQTVTVTGKVWNLASAAPITPTSPINLGIVHVGGTFGTQALTIQNTATAGVSEGLDAGFGTLTGSASGTGTITTLAAGSSNSTSLVVGLGGSAHTATAGNITGTAPVNLTSDGTGTSGLASTPLTSQAITVNGVVNNFAQPLFSLTNAFGTLVENTPTSYTLTLTGTTGTADLSVANTSLSPGFQDTLGGSYTTTGVTHYTLGGTTAFSGIAAGSTQSGLTVSLTGTSPGTSDSLLFSPTSANASGTSPLSAITLTINDGVASTVATIDNSQASNTEPGTFNGSVVSASVAVGAGANGYAGVTSTVGAGIGAQGSKSAGIEGSVINQTATILAGSNSGTFGETGAGGTSNSVGMTWRTRLLTETPANDASANGNATGFVAGTPTSPPLPGGNNPHGLISDVVNLFGMGTGSTATSTTPVQTDPFAFELSFNPKTINAEGASGNAIASHGNLYLASFVGTSWENTIIPNFSVAGGSTALYNGVTIQIGSQASAAMGGNFGRPLLESYATFAAADGVTAANLGNFLGVWGVDTTNDEAWAVIDHNSLFAVVPEPSAIVLAAFGLLGCMFIVRRRKNVVVA